MEILKKLCSIHAPSGSEGDMKDFLMQYVKTQSASWKVRPRIIEGEEFQECLILVFGKPRTAIFAHIDSIGFMVKYGRELVKIGGPKIRHNWLLTGTDSKGDIECEMDVPEGSQKAFYKFDREIDRGTTLTFKCDYRQSEEFIQSCYLDNRLGVWAALKVAETLENGIICFSTFEEVGGGAVEFLGRYIYEKYGVRRALIAEITWVTDGVKHGKGVAISMRDRLLPRRAFLNEVLELAKTSGIDYQLEVEDAGGSDGHRLHFLPYPFDWCFIGAPEDNVHTPDEKVHLKDIICMMDMYKYLMEKL